MSAPVDVLRPYARDTGAFRVNNKGATELAEALAAVFEMIEAVRGGVETRTHNGFVMHYDEVKADRLAAALARVGGAE